MDTSNLKKFATEARSNLIKGVVDRLRMLGFDENGHVEEADRPELLQGGALFHGELKQGDAFYKKWMALELAIKNHPHGPKVGVRQVAEAAAYTWFNRFVAIRILQKNSLIEPQLAYADGGRIPMIVENARSGRLPILTPDEKMEWERISDDDSKVLEQFTLLIVAYCHTTPILEKCFGHIDDYTELLLPRNVLADGGFIDLLNTTDYITEEDYRQTELIGWLYQFYISEKKDEVFASFKNKKKAEAEDIPAATQIFTPNWIVKYMVQNTLGRIYLDNNKGSDLAKDWKYLVDTPTVPDAIYRYAELESLKVADFASGSGHILNEFFDMLYSFYEEEAYDSREAVECIFRKNLIGIDLDTRAKQLSMFSLLLKACQKNRRFVDASVLPRILDMPDVEPNGYTWKEVGGHFCCRLDFETPEKVSKELLEAFTLLGSAKNLGSTMKFNVGNATREYMQRCLQYRDEHPEAFDRNVADFAPIFESFELILALTDRYSAIAMNPPYMGNINMNSELSDYVKGNYPNSKADLFSVFMDVAIDRLAENAKYGIINMHSWMFLGSFENLRKDLLDHYHIENMIHLGPRTFDELSGEVVQNTAYVICKSKSYSERSEELRTGTYFRLVDGIDCSDKERMFLDANNNHTDKVYYSSISQSNLKKIPGSPVGYWVSDSVRNLFIGKSSINDVCMPLQGMSTTDNSRYIRLWHEIDNKKMQLGTSCAQESVVSQLKWYPINKGGGTRKWYGNQYEVIDWFHNGVSVKSNPKAVIRGEEGYFLPCISWNKICSTYITFRFFPKGFLVDSASNVIPCENLYSMMAYLCSKLTNLIGTIINPTLNLSNGVLGRFPNLSVENDELCAIVKKCIKITKSDWDAHETSWDFAVNEIVDLDSEDKFMNTVGEINELTGEQQTFDTPDFGSIEKRLQLVKSKWRARFEKLHENEEELNRQFIEIYGLQDELTPDVPLDEVTILQQGEISIEEDGETK